MDVVVEKDRRIESIAEACNMLKLSRSKLYDLVDEGKLHRVKIGHRSFITRASLDALLDEAFAEAGFEAEQTGGGAV